MLPYMHILLAIIGSRYFRPGSRIQASYKRVTGSALSHDPLFPTLDVAFYLRQLTAMEDWLLDAVAFLLAIVIEQTEGIAAKEDDSHKVAGRKEGHEEINDVPHQFKAGEGTEYHHQSCRCNAIGRHHFRIWCDEPDVSLTVVIVADDVDLLYYY